MKRLAQRHTRKAIVKISDKIALPVEIADTPRQLTEGLQGRKELEGGMLFIHPEETEVSYWMRGTELPLSIAFFNNDGKIIHIADMNPHDETPVTPPEPVKYALEVKQGTFASRDVSIGDTIKIVKAQATSLPSSLYSYIEEHKNADVIIPEEVYDYIDIAGIEQNPSIRLLRDLQEHGRPNTMSEAVLIKVEPLKGVTVDIIDKWYYAIRHAINNVSDIIEKGKELDILE